MPFVGTGLAAVRCGRFGVDLPPELIELLKYGRGIDNRRLKEAGFKYRYTSAGAVEAFVEALRLKGTVGARPRLPVRGGRRELLPALPRRRPRSTGGTDVSLIRCEVADRVATITLDDPDRRNALTLDMVDEIVAAVDGLEADDGVGAVVVTGAPPAFCAGADLSHLGSSQQRGPASHLRGLPPGRPLHRCRRSPP